MTGVFDLLLLLLLLGLALLFLLGGLKNRSRLEKLPLLPPSDEPVGEGWRFLHAPGVEIDEATRRASVAYARAAGLQVVDLLPHDWPALDALGLSELCDPDEYREVPLTPGVSGWHGLLVAEQVLSRLGEADRLAIEEGFSSRPDFVRFATRLKRWAPRATGLAIAPCLAAAPVRGGERRRCLRAALGDLSGAVLALQGMVYAILLLGLWQAPFPALVAVFCYHAQALYALHELPLAGRDLLSTALFRLPMDLWIWLRTVLADEPDAGEPAEVSALRAEYEALVAGGVERFFEERRQGCPLCGSEQLSLHLEAGDYFQHKPGRFRLERCGGCEHVFQNPRLTPEGLGYYYRDFYDGLGEEKLDFVFSWDPKIYLRRAAVLEGHHVPERWLDVGGGHGHLCLMAKELYPWARFEALDMADAVLEAERRGWVDRGWRGQFPELVSELDAGYDVLSMSHYLEHTPEPRAELESAARALVPGGVLLIELPDPESPLGRFLGWTWLPWFQPQHLHFLSVGRLEGLLDEQGFDVELVQRAEAHQKADFTYAALMILNRYAPPPDVPWRPPATSAERARHGLIWLVGLPCLMLGLLLDALAAPLAGRLGFSNTFRMLARKR